MIQVPDVDCLLVLNFEIKTIMLNVVVLNVIGLNVVAPN
jgi:hypothetical protein